MSRSISLQERILLTIDIQTFWFAGVLDLEEHMGSQSFQHLAR